MKQTATEHNYSKTAQCDTILMQLKYMKIINDPSVRPQIEVVKRSLLRNLLWKHSCGILDVVSCGGILAVVSLLWNPHCKILAVES